jgi:tricorn protease
MRLILACFFMTTFAAAADEPLLLQKPTLNKTHIVFAYAGDLWSVPRDGGDAVRLTSGTGIETDAAFSPDGKQIAFTGEYDGNVDVFVVPLTGGVPKRLTWHPAPDRVLGWTPDGKRIIFSSPRTAYSRFAEMFTIPAEGGVEEKLPLPTDTKRRCRPMDSPSPTNPSERRSLCGSDTGAVRLLASGWPASPTAW